MAKVNTFHSSVTLDVHHDDDACTEGNNIETRNRVAGTGGLPLCMHCRVL